MGSVYDENLIDNVFFKEIQEHYCEILEKASGSNWIICIPRSSLFTKGKISRNDVLEHILVPNVNGEPHYHNLHQQDVNICNNLIRIKIGDVTNTVRLLFNEIFHVGKSKYSLWCIDGILNQKNYYHTADVFEINNLCDCIDILWTDNAELIIEIHNIVKSWILEYNISRLNLTKLKPVIKGLYEQCLKCIKSKEKIENKIKDVNFYNNVQISVETYMQFCLEKECLSALCVCVLDVETKFNKIVRNVQDISLRSFDISPDLYECLPLAKQELNQINKYYTVLEKVVCLKQTFDILSTETSKSILNTEHLLEIFIFLIIKSNIYNWVTNLVFIKKFRFSIKNTASENDFLIANLQAAIEYIKSGAVLNKYKIFDVDNNSSLDLAQNDNLKKLFLYISDNNLKEVKEFITNQNIDTNIKLCHPFCSCDKCENLIEIKMCNINSSNDRGLTALHVAGICGNPDIVDFLISKGANLDSVDTAGFTPLHYAVSKGHQHITFLMLHSGSNINASDNEGNTPLHIATKNGHENCVKALIYFSKHLSYDVYINCVNNLGNTPLHFAAKFGYVSLVKLLIQNGAKIIKNKRKFTPEHVAHNYLVMRFLAHAEIEENSVAEQRVERRKKSSLQQNAIKEKSSDSCLRNSLDVSELRLKAENEGVKRRVSFCFDRDYHNQRKLIDFGVRPKNVDQFKKVDLLLKAVENNDLPLTCFYLGIPLPNVTDNIQSTCHPLCTCEKCSDEFIEKEVDETAAQLEHLNINICNSNGYTAIHFAAKYGRTEILRLLLDAGALINLKTYETFYTPLHLACMHQRIQIARELLKCGSCITDVADFNGNTPLHHACLKNDSRLFELLLSQGGDVTIKNNDGKTVLNTAKDKMFFNIVKILVPNNVHSSDFDIV